MLFGIPMDQLGTAAILVILLIAGCMWALRVHAANIEEERRREAARKKAGRSPADRAQDGDWL